MSLMIRITSSLFRVLPKCQQVVCSKQQDVFLFGSKFTRTFSKQPKLFLRQTDVSPENNPKDWMLSALPMRYIYVNTCQQRWEDIPDGFFFDTGYVDSHPGSPFNPNVPLVFAVHDMYGGHESLLPLLAPLVLKNYRVIAINLPSSNHTNAVGFGHEDGFLHSTDEYAEFIGDFLAEMKIPKVDLMLGQGTGCIPLLRICAKTDLCQSAVLICPTGHIPYKGIQPYKMYEQFVMLWETPFLRPYLKVVAYLLKHLKGLGKHTTDKVITSFKVIRGMDFDSIGSYLFNLKVKQFPVGVLYCKKDALIEAKISQSFCQLLGLEEEQMTSYDKNGQITKKATLNSKGIILEEKPNNICQEFHLPLINMIEKLINLVHQRV